MKGGGWRDHLCSDVKMLAVILLARVQRQYLTDRRLDTDLGIG